MFKKCLISILAILPLGAASYAAQFEKAIEQKSEEELQVEFDYKIQNNELPKKYYQYLIKNNILSIEELYGCQNEMHYERLLSVYLEEQNALFMRYAGSISLGGMK